MVKKRVSKIKARVTKHQRELLVLEKEELTPMDWMPMEFEESKRILGLEKNMRSGGWIAIR